MSANASSVTLPRMDTAAVLERIEERLKAIGLSADAASRAAGKPDAIRNLRRAVEKGGRQGVTMTTLAALAPVLRTTTGYLMDGGAEPALQPSTLKPAAAGALTYARVSGTLQAGVFRDVEVFSDELDEVISAPANTRYPWARQFAWQVAGDSMNTATPKPINDGDFVIGIAYEDIQENVPLRSGLKVVVRQTRDAGQSWEWTVKELVLTDEHAEFHPRSTNPAHKPIIVKRDLTADDGRRVEILALVQYVFDNHPIEF